MFTYSELSELNAKELKQLCKYYYPGLKFSKYANRDTMLGLVSAELSVDIYEDVVVEDEPNMSVQVRRAKESLK